MNVKINEWQKTITKESRKGNFKQEGKKLYYNEFCKLGVQLAI